MSAQHHHRAPATDYIPTLTQHRTHLIRSLFFPSFIFHKYEPGSVCVLCVCVSVCVCVNVCACACPFITIKNQLTEVSQYRWRQLSALRECVIQDFVMVSFGVKAQMRRAQPYCN